MILIKALVLDILGHVIKNLNLESKGCEFFFELAAFELRVQKRTRNSNRISYNYQII